MEKLPLSIKEFFPNMLKGAAMGIAEIIPGVSGGTIAFITGIYERLLRAIRSFGPEAVRGFRAAGLRGLWLAIDGNFLLSLIFGMAVGIIFGVLVITWILDNYPVLLWSFFFGLILSSVWYVAKQIEYWRLVVYLLFAAGGVVAFYITIAQPSQGNTAYWFVFVSGSIAISALMLPGISGSFILLLMGMYTYILPTIKEAMTTMSAEALTVLVIFGAGCVFGMAVFSRLLTWTFARYHDATMGVLAGFMLGSLNKIWPWRNVVSYRTNSHGDQVPFLEHSVWPQQFEGEPYLTGAIILMIIGFLTVLFLERISIKETVGEIIEETDIL